MTPSAARALLKGPLEKASRPLNSQAKAEQQQPLPVDGFNNKPARGDVAPGNDRPASAYLFGRSHRLRLEQFAPAVSGHGLARAH